jgi:hypothetical protein
MPLFCTDSRELVHPTGHWVGLYYYARWPGDHALDAAFDAIADDIPPRLARASAAFGRRIVWSIAVLGCPPNGLLHPRQAIRDAYDRMWARHPGLWEAMAERSTPLLAFWLVDVGLRPSFGQVYRSGDDAILLLNADVRNSEMYNLLHGQGTEVSLVIHAVNPELLAAAEGGFQGGADSAEPSAAPDPGGIPPFES